MVNLEKYIGALITNKTPKSSRDNDPHRKNTIGSILSVGAHLSSKSLALSGVLGFSKSRMVLPAHLHKSSQIPFKLTKPA
jgi:hypothetical protein